MYRIVRKEALKPTVILYEIEAPMVAKKAEPGQFIILRVDEKGERIPITIHDYDREKGTVTIIVQTVGATTENPSLAVNPVRFRVSLFSRRCCRAARASRCHRCRFPRSRPFCRTHCRKTRIWTRK